ncbi:MAG: 3-phosphoserine/phosphohydroxythreonine transaminase [Janthinobacterium lividum]
MRQFNFSAGPAALPEEVLRQAAEEMLEWRGTGVSVMEMSHRSSAYLGIYEEARDTLRQLLEVPSNYQILFMQGGALAENALIPMNLLGERQLADYVVTGSWSAKSIAEAARYCSPHLAASTQSSGFRSAPGIEAWQLSVDPAYVHFCSNETINGVEYFDFPDTGAVPLVADASSHLLSRPMDVSKVGVLYGGAQKNIGMAGLTLVIVRDDLLDRARLICPTAFHWKTVAQNDSMYNTPPTYAIYIAGLVFQWLLRQGGLPGIEQRNIEKARLLYETIDRSDLYVNEVDLAARSRMNVPFFLKDASRNDAFLQGAQQRGLLQLKGHKSVGGMRASIYNAVPLAAVQALTDYMKEFERRA